MGKLIKQIEAAEDLGVETTTICLVTDDFMFVGAKYQLGKFSELQALVRRYKAMEEALKDARNRLVLAMAAKNLSFAIEMATEARADIQQALKETI